MLKPGTREKSVVVGPRTLVFTRKTHKKTNKSGQPISALPLFKEKGKKENQRKTYFVRILRKVFLEKRKKNNNKTSVFRDQIFLGLKHLLAWKQTKLTKVIWAICSFIILQIDCKRWCSSNLEKNY